VAAKWVQGWKTYGEALPIGGGFKTQKMVEK